MSESDKKGKLAVEEQGTIVIPGAYMTEESTEGPNMNVATRRAPGEYIQAGDGRMVRMNRAARRAKASQERKGKKTGSVVMRDPNAVHSLRRK